MLMLDTAGADANGIARANAHLTLALIDLLIQKHVLTIDEVKVAILTVCDHLEKSTSVGEQRAAKVLRHTFSGHERA